VEKWTLPGSPLETRVLVTSSPFVLVPRHAKPYVGDAPTFLMQAAQFHLVIVR
jgi:hypothetical protein